MKKKLSLLLLVLGLALILAGDYYYGRRMDLRDKFLWLGLVLALGSFIWMMMIHSSTKDKFLWLGLFVAGFLMVDWLSPFVSSLSLRRYIAQHRTQLEEANGILSRTPGNVSVLATRFTGDSTQLTPAERERLADLQRSLGTDMIYKNNGKVHYELWGFLDDRISVTYCGDAMRVEEGMRPLEGRWYW